MLTSSNFEPTIDNAPCPPFFVENVYDIFIEHAGKNNLSENVTVEVWNKCSLQYPYPTTTTRLPTTTSTTETTTTSTTILTTTSTTEQRTPTTEQTTPTTEQRTPTTEQRTSTVQQTTTSITKPTTTPTTEQRTPTTEQRTPTTEQTTPTTEQTTPTTEQTTPKVQQTTTSITKPTTASTTEKTTTSRTEQTTTIKTPTAIPTSRQTRVVTTRSITSATDATRGGATAECDTYCLALMIGFSICILVGILIAAICCSANRRRKRKHTLKRKHLRHRKEMITNGKYIPKFPKINRQANLKMAPLAFVNPTFLDHNVTDAHILDTKRHRHHIVYSPENHEQPDLFTDVDHSHYDVTVYPGKPLGSVEERMNSDGFVHPYQRYANKRSRHTSVGSHIPKVIGNNEEIYPFSVDSYEAISDRKSLSKINNEEYSDIGPHKLPRIPFDKGPYELQRNPFDTGPHELPRIPFDAEPHELPRIPFNAGPHKLPRIPLEDHVNLTENYSNAEKSVFPLEGSQNIDKRIENSVMYDLLRTPVHPVEISKESNYTIAWSDLPRTELEAQSRADKISDNHKHKHGLPRTPFEEPHKRDVENGLPRIPPDRLETVL